MHKITVTCIEQINKALNWVDGGLCKGLEGGAVDVTLCRHEPVKSDIQRDKFHAMIGDINKTGVISIPGRRIVMRDYDPDQCKALLVVWFAQEKESLGEPLAKPPRNFTDPISGQQISIRPSTVQWGKKLTCEFVEWLYMTGAQANVIWSEPAIKEYQNYREAQQ